MALTLGTTPPSFGRRATHGFKPSGGGKTLQEPVNRHLTGRSAHKGTPTEDLAPKPRPKYNRHRSSSEGSPIASTSHSVLVSGSPSISRLYPSFIAPRPISSSLLSELYSAPPPYTKDPEPTSELRITQMPSDTDDDPNEDDMLYTSSRQANAAKIASSSSQSLRNRIFALASSSPRPRHKTICTTPGTLCAGETETETDEPVSFTSILIFASY